MKNNAILEDASLQNILFAISVEKHLKSDLTNDLKELINIHIDSNLTKIRKLQGSNNHPEYEESKIRTLNSVYLLWKKEKPFTSNKWSESEANKFWFEDWVNNHSRNLDLLIWASRECQKYPKLNCKTEKLLNKS